MHLLFWAPANRKLEKVNWTNCRRCNYLYLRVHCKPAVPPQSGETTHRMAKLKMKDFKLESAASLLSCNFRVRWRSKICQSRCRDSGGLQQSALIWPAIYEIYIVFYYEVDGNRRKSSLISFCSMLFEKIQPKPHQHWTEFFSGMNGQHDLQRIMQSQNHGAFSLLWPVLKNTLS